MSEDEIEYLIDCRLRMSSTQSNLKTLLRANFKNLKEFKQHSRYKYFIITKKEEQDTLCYIISGLFKDEINKYIAAKSVEDFKKQNKIESK